jgi:hypothetical protein
MTYPEVRALRNPPKSCPFDDAFEELLPGELEQQERAKDALWNLSENEFRSLRKRGYELSEEEMRVSAIAYDAPADAAGRLRMLQQMLQSEEEFEARYPEAFEVLYPRNSYTGRPIAERRGLHLPSFGVRILNNWVLPRIEEPFRTGGADAFTLTTFWQKPLRGYEAGPKTDALEYDDLHGILLAILGRVERDRIGDPGFMFKPEEPVDGVRSPQKCPIRLTDLRLAGDLKPGALKSGLAKAFQLLHTPSSAPHVVLWKTRLLGVDGLSPRADATVRFLSQIPVNEFPPDLLAVRNELLKFMRSSPRERLGAFANSETSLVDMRPEILKQCFGDMREGIAAVSFAAAAMWLFLDLKVPGIRNAKPYRLAELVESLAEILRKLLGSSELRAKELGYLLTNKPVGRHPNLPANDYLALCKYRMGWDLRSIAEWLEINPYSSQTGVGTRDWKRRVGNRLRRGKDFEDQHYPRASAIFALSDNPIIRAKARRTYRGYLLERGRYGACMFWHLRYWSRTTSWQTERGQELISAYLQLGSCVLQKIDPIP